MNIRNIAIIAHVDHGKTTLVDALLKLSETHIGKDRPQERIMDSNDLERERGITIFSKNAAMVWADTKINIIDTPGHADFGGEVERVLKMADGALLLVDAKEGPMPQTKFVLKKALEMGHKIIVVINKIDKKDARPEWVLDQTFDLFVELGASDEQTDFPVIYASAINGVAGEAADLSVMKDVTPIFETIIKNIPAPGGDVNAPLQMLVVSLAQDNYKGKIGIGRIVNGQIKRADTVMHINRAGEQKKEKVAAMMTFEGLGRIDVEEASAGDICAVAGIADISIGDTIASAENPIALPPLQIEQPTVKMTFRVNDSPFAGREGQYSTSRNLRERLYKELETDVALRVVDGETPDAFVVSGRGELHLAILIEKMRREGYELAVSRPEVITREEAGVTLEPAEDVYLEVKEEFAGTVIEQMGKRRGEMKNYAVTDGVGAESTGIAHLHFVIPTRGLIGYRSEFLTDTKGTGLLNTLFHGYIPWQENIVTNPHGSLISFESGTSSGYGLANGQERGELFIGPAVEVYEGMIIGQNAKAEDLEVNICKEKRLTNMRSSSADIAIQLSPPREMTLEQSIEYIGDDEWVEVTPKSIRLRKSILPSIERKRARR
ncbi:MAG: GTP-binding protein TypA, GTP-binding protein [Candidatus Magasanikbacteria bacterium]|nr:GTP-binding protein TypA, GTP-binding protein [Candidatus Magasanikbacteria bacterium]